MADFNFLTTNVKPFLNLKRACSIYVTALTKIYNPARVKLLPGPEH